MQSKISFTLQGAPKLLKRARCEAERDRQRVGAEMMASIEAVPAARGFIEARLARHRSRRLIRSTPS